VFFVLVQLSDPHVGAQWLGADSLATLAHVVESVGTLLPGPDAILVSGDLAEHATDAEYEDVRRLVSSLGAPVFVAAGNHDDRTALRRLFDVPGMDAKPVQYAAELGPLRLVVLDTTRPGEDDGELDVDRLAWLDATLMASDKPTVVAMHHPPLPSGLPAFDRISLTSAETSALRDVITRHPHVCRLVAGHAHHACISELGTCTVVVAPSSYLQASLDLRSPEISFDDRHPSGYVVHTLVGDQLVSHVGFAPAVASS
jgi:3',5'-cyclic AMP phosphodiesterase CpdA